MRLSTVFELLLIFLFLAFAASRTIHGKKGVKSIAKQTQNKYCQCSQLMCNCCRDFTLPVVSLKGPGCATVAYLNDDAMRLTMTFGDKVLRNITLAGKRPNPVCMALPGGVSKFCGRVYGITRDGDHFKACLALELRSLEDLEAALRVSCFRFGPEGVKLEAGKPVPAAPVDEDEDDDDDDYGLSDDEDDDDDDDDFGLGDDDDDDEDDDEAENDVDSGDTDYTGFSALSDEFLGGFFGTSSDKKPTKSTPKPVQVTVPTNTKDKTTKTATPKVTISTSKPHIIVKNKTTTTTASYPESTSIISTTQSKEINYETTSTQSYPKENEKNDMDMHSDEDTKISESSTEDAGYTPEDDEDSSEEESSSIETNSKNNTESSQSSEEENTESNDIINSMTVVEEERKFPTSRGHSLTPAETEKLFPGLTALIRPPSHTSYNFPPVRSARTHRRMRLPPVEI